LTIREGTNYAGSSPDLPHNPLQRIVGLQLDPVLVREGVEAEGLRNMCLDQLGRLGEPHRLQLGNDVLGLLGGRLAALLGMDGLQHVGYIRVRLEDPVREPIVENKLPDILDRVQLGGALSRGVRGRAGRSRKPGTESQKSFPFGFVETTLSSADRYY